MYMEVQTFDIKPIHEQITAYETSYLSGRTGSLIFDPLIALLFAVGGWMIFRELTMEKLLVLFLFVVTAAFLFLTISLPWQRYFLIMQISYALIAGLGAGYVWKWTGQFLQRSNIKAI